jgi:hypothetical protein
MSSDGTYHRRIKQLASMVEELIHCKALLQQGNDRKRSTIVAVVADYLGCWMGP